MFPTGLDAQPERIEEAKRALRCARTIDGAAMSILSDVQEMMERGATDRARRWINFVKWMLCNRELLAEHEEK